MLTRQGFQLIECLIVLSIMAVIAAFGFSSYQYFLLKAQYVEAIQALGVWSLSLEEYHFAHGTYQGALHHQHNSALMSANQHYVISLHSATNEYYTLHAHPIKKNSNDHCGDFILTSRGEKHITGKASLEDCWG